MISWIKRHFQRKAIDKQIRSVRFKIRDLRSDLSIDEEWKAQIILDQFKVIRKLETRKARA